MVSLPTAATRRDPFTPVEPDDEPAVLAERLEQWQRYHEPEPGYAEWVMARVVVASTRLDRAVAHEAALRSYEANRARLSWDEDRRLAAEDLGAKLHKDPARLRRRLEETLQGADWLIERWDALARVAETGRAWSGPQRALALDLLGTPPALRDGPCPFDAAAGEDPAPVQAALARFERSRIGRLCERLLVARDESERVLAESGVPLSLSPAMTRLHRHEALWAREYHRAFSEFRRTCRRPSEAEAEAEPEPALAPASVPLPPSPPPDPRSANSHAELAALDRMLLAGLLKARRDAGIESNLMVDDDDVVAAVPASPPLPLRPPLPAPDEIS